MLTKQNDVMQERQQVQELGQVLEAAHGFRRLHEAQAGIAARRAIAWVLHTLTRLGNALKGVLDVRTHAAVAGRMVDAVCGMAAGGRQNAYNVRPFSKQHS